MDANVQYLAEEIAENCADGLLTRREAMRRLAYLGISAVGASTLLAACGSDSTTDDSAIQAPTTAGSATTAPPSGPATTTAPVAAQDITYPGKGITMRGAFAPAASPKGAVLVIHENQGLTPFVRSMAGRLAGTGFSALALDLLSAQGGTATFTDPATIGPALTQNATERSVDDMRSSLDELGRRVPGVKLAAIGFCFGGNMTWELLKAGDPPPLAAAVPFYGQASNPDFSKTKAAVLAIYGETDTRVNANQPIAKDALTKAGLTHELRTFPGVPHAFMRGLDDPASPNYPQALLAYAAMIDWFARHLR